MSLHALLSQSHTYFKKDYDSAVRLFENTVTNYKTLIDRRQTYVHPMPSPSEESLRTEAVWLGNPLASKVLIISSGTHGIEGYCGSAIQSFLLQCLHEKHFEHNETTAILFLHALNPWGMAWARRCDEQGIDLNRNFLDYGNLPESSPYFPEILHCLSDSNSLVRAAGLHQLTLKLGQTAFDQAFSEGQYTTPWAPFYGGVSKAFGRLVCEKAVDDFALAGREIVMLDLHTGLGPYGYGELISDHALNTPAIAYSKKMFGASVAHTHGGDSFSVPKLGLLDYFWHDYMNKNGCFLTLEFGTHGTTALFDVIFDDHYFWKNTPPTSLHDDAYQTTRNAMLAHFCPDDSIWQQSTLFRAWQVVQSTLKSFCNDS